MVTMVRRPGCSESAAASTLNRLADVESQVGQLALIERDKELLLEPTFDLNGRHARDRLELSFHLVFSEVTKFVERLRTREAESQNRIE